MKKIAVINLVGLSKRILNAKDAPFLSSWIEKRNLTTIEPVLPSVTCSVQSTYLTGKWPSEHGIVANGWYFRDENEVKLWRQSNALVQSKKVWDEARRRDSNFTCANMFWWYNMYSTVDFSVTPRPQYLADGRKLPDCYSQPSQLRDKLQNDLGIFPLFDFWGPKTSIKSSQWIANASEKVLKWHDPTLLLVYLPHMDYVIQKFGPEHVQTGKDLRQLDDLCSSFIPSLEKEGRKVILLSEYGITKANQPIHINRHLRENGWINVRIERGTELLDAGASSAFAVADHQIAHIYINDHSIQNQVISFLKEIQGIELVLDNEGKKKYHIDHPRSGDLVIVAKPGFWFTYYFWLDDKNAPDYARTVDIHKKPGYDPVEMFIDPDKPLEMARIVGKVLGKKLGFRTVMDFIPLKAELVQGSHGAINLHELDKAILALEGGLNDSSVLPTSIYKLILKEIFNGKEEQLPGD